MSSEFEQMDPELAEIVEGMTPEEMRELAAELEERARVMIALPLLLFVRPPTRSIYRRRL